MFGTFDDIQTLWCDYYVLYLFGRLPNWKHHAWEEPLHERKGKSSFPLTELHGLILTTAWRASDCLHIRIKQTSIARYSHVMTYGNCSHALKWTSAAFCVTSLLHASKHELAYVNVAFLSTNPPHRTNERPRRAAERSLKRTRWKQLYKYSYVHDFAPMIFAVPPEIKNHKNALLIDSPKCMFSQTKKRVQYVCTIFLFSFFSVYNLADCQIFLENYSARPRATEHEYARLRIDVRFPALLMQTGDLWKIEQTVGERKSDRLRQFANKNGNLP